MKLLELNEAIESGEINEIIRVTEARQVKRLGALADTVCAAKRVRIVLLAGASSAGKTTTAMRLCTQLRVNGMSALHISTDDYFLGPESSPRDANGKPDFEHVDCVDIPRLVRDMKSLVCGETIRERKYDFVNHRGFDTERSLTLPGDGIVVLEGIHAMNPRLTDGLDESVKYRLFIEPKPDLDIFGGICPKSSDARLLRRLVRDNHYRKMSPAKTFDMWPNVLAGEEKWINPFRPFADANFDSYLSYEMAVLKPYVGGLLERARQELGERRDVAEMLQLIKGVSSVSAASVPGDSILRETIGGSQLDY